MVSSNYSGHSFLTPQRLWRFAGIYNVWYVGRPAAAPRTTHYKGGPLQVVRVLNGYLTCHAR